MKFMKRVAAVILGIILILGGIVLYNTSQFTSKQLAAEPAELISIDADAAAQRLSTALTFRTTSHMDASRVEAAEFTKFHNFLRRSFPLADAAFERETVATHSLLYKWNGTDDTLKPALLMGHMDAVPVEPGTEDKWTHDAFSGAIADGFIWGRGALDDKSTVVGLMEAAEALLAEGFTPKRTVYFAFGHDEEIGGRGAVATATLLKERGIELDYVLDEGGVLTQGMIPGVDAPVAMVATAEKGYLTLEIIAEVTGGHSSRPPKDMAVALVSEAIHKLVRNPMPAGIRGAMSDFFDYVGPEMPFLNRMAFANRWLFDPIIESRLVSNPTMAAMIRTTTAPTMFEAGIKDNVLPSRARGIVNFRLVPGETGEEVIERVRKLVAHPALTVNPLADTISDPSPVSDHSSPQFQRLMMTIRQVTPGAIVAPYLVIGGTDARHYVGLSPNVFRYNGITFQADDMSRVHGTNERIGVDNYARAIQFYAQLIRNTTQ